MLVVLETDEAWSLLMVVTSYIIDHSGVSQEGKQHIRRWRNQRSVGTVEMDDLTEAVNEALGAYLGEKMTRQIRRRGRFLTTREGRE